MIEDLLRKRPGVQVHPLWFLTLFAVQSLLLFAIWLWKRLTRWA